MNRCIVEWLSIEGVDQTKRHDSSDMTKQSVKRCRRYGCRKQALRKFCSDACRIAHHNSQRPPADRVKVTCQGCGKVFQGRPDQKSCSATCRSRLFRAKQRGGEHSQTDSALPSIEWGRSTPFSPAQLRQKMQKRHLEPGVEYSWLPAKPKKVRIRRAQHNADQMRLDFGLDDGSSHDQ